MTILDFLSLNLRAAEAGIRRLTSPDAADPPGLWQVADASAPGRMIGAARRAVAQAAPGSRARAAWHTASRSWTALPAIARMRVTGATAMIAAATHVALAATTAPVGGWWLILPGMVMLFGVSALALSWLGPSSEPHG